MGGRPVTLVTGASSGLGAEFARQCAARGDALALVARRRDRLEALKAELGGDTHLFDHDLSVPGAAVRLTDALASAGLEVEVLVNNAGFGQWRAFADSALERQRGMVDLNCGALVELSRLVLPPMLAQRRGFILNVASIAAYLPGPGSAVYYASKAFVLSFTEALHQELKGSGVHVTALCPGPVRTEFARVAGVSSAAFDRMALEAGPVVRAGLKGLARGRAVVIPGAFPKASVAGSRLLPRSLMARIVAGVKLTR